jgi:DNA polymerase I-like protein with 3'-5' exonuclease and polymerase domains/uracil-DNA glycosylase
MGVNPEKVKYPKGPNCEGCPFWETSRGFAVTQGVRYRYEKGAWLEYGPGPLFASADYMFIAEGLGRQETELGNNLVGPTGGTFNYLLHNNTPIRRPDCVVSNAVRCRPIVYSGGEPVTQKNGDYVNMKPSPEQVRECYERYGKEELQVFAGGTIVGMGAVVLSLFTGGGKALSEMVGTIFEHGSLIPCVPCEGSGLVARPQRICPKCKRKGTVKCEECGRWTKHTKKCEAGEAPFRSCPDCGGPGLIPRPPRVCPDCHGNREVPSDPGAPYVSRLLKPDQIFYPTYHPAYLFRKPNEKRAFAANFARIPTLREELKVEAGLHYDRSPDSAGIREILETKVLSIDLETSAFIPDRGEVQIIGISPGPGRAAVAQPEDRNTLDYLERSSETDEIEIVGQNWMMFDAWWMWKKHGILPPKRMFDTLLAAHLLDPDSPKNLPFLVRQYADPPIRGYWKTRDHYRDDKGQVAMIDTDGAFRVRNGLVTALAEQGMSDAYWNEVMPTMYVAFDMRKAGWRVNVPDLALAHGKVAQRVNLMREDLPEWRETKAGVRTENQSEFVNRHAYQTLSLPVLLDRTTYQPSFGSEQRSELKIMLETGNKKIEHLTFEEIDESLRFINLIDDLKESSKLMTFLNPESIHLSNKNKFHSTWDPSGTATFRFASREPNLQQVPKCACNPECYGTNPECAGARFPFVPPFRGWKMLSVDYSQIEVVGFLWTASQWDVLGKVLHEGLDAHAVMADQLSMMRKVAKHMTFALVYGASDDLIAARSKKSEAEVKVARAHYLKVFPGVEQFRNHYIHYAMKHGFVVNAFGRKRYVWVRSPIGRAANQAANAPIQGIPPMIVRRAMVRLAQELPAPAHIIGNIHDELIITYPEELEQKVIECVTDIMRSPIPEMPAKPLGMGDGLVCNIDIATGTTWANMRDI